MKSAIEKMLMRDIGILQDTAILSQVLTEAIVSSIKDETGYSINEPKSPADREVFDAMGNFVRLLSKRLATYDRPKTRRRRR
jgi:hypothetical protein